MDENTEIWLVCFSDNDECYFGYTSYCATKEQAKRIFDERKEYMKLNYKDQVAYFEEDELNCEGYADRFANDTVCSLSCFPIKLNGEWLGNLDW